MRRILLVFCFCFLFFAFKVYAHRFKGIGQDTCPDWQINILQHPICTGALSRTTIEVPNAPEPLNYTWDNGQTGPVATGLLPGDHQLTITDASGGCALTHTFTVETKKNTLPLLASIEIPELRGSFLTRIKELPNGDIMIAGGNNNQSAVQFFICRTTPNGQVIWKNWIPGTFDDWHFTNAGEMTLAYHANLSLPSQGFNNQDAFIARYTAGGALVWETRIGGENYDKPNSIAVQPDGRVLAFIQATSGNSGNLTQFSGTGEFISAFLGNDGGVIGGYRSSVSVFLPMNNVPLSNGNWLQLGMRNASTLLRKMDTQGNLLNEYVLPFNFNPSNIHAYADAGGFAHLFGLTTPATSGQAGFLLDLTIDNDSDVFLSQDTLTSVGYYNHFEAGASGYIIRLQTFQYLVYDQNWSVLADATFPADYLTNGENNTFWSFLKTTEGEVSLLKFGHEPVVNADFWPEELVACLPDSFQLVAPPGWGLMVEWPDLTTGAVYTSGLPVYPNLNIKLSDSTGCKAEEWIRVFNSSFEVEAESSEASCGNANGAIALTTFSNINNAVYHWADTPENLAYRSGLSPGTYQVTVNDAYCSTVQTIDVEKSPADRPLPNIKWSAGEIATVAYQPVYLENYIQALDARTFPNGKTMLIGKKKTYLTRADGAVQWSFDNFPTNWQVTPWINDAILTGNTNQVVIYDSTGQAQPTQTLVDLQNHSFNKFISDPSGFLYVLSPDFAHDGVFIFKYDENLQLIWQKSYVSGLKDQYFNMKPAMAANGNWFLLTETAPLPDNTDNTDAVVLAFNANGDLLWRTSFGGAKRDVGAGLSPVGNEVLIGIDARSTDGNLTAPSNAVSGNALWVLRLDADGHVLWANPYPKHLLMDMDATPNGQVLLLSRKPVSNSFRTYLSRLDTDGQLIWRKFDFASPDYQPYFVAPWGNEGYWTSTNGMNSGYIPGSQNQVYVNAVGIFLRHVVMPDFALQDTATICRGNSLVLPDHPLDFAWGVCPNCSAGNDQVVFYSPGTYIVRYGPSSFCLPFQDSISIGIQDGTLKIASVEAVNPPCANGTGGSIEISLSGQVNPVTYHWSNGATTASIQNLPAGVYGVVVQDSSTCRRDTSFTITAPPPVNLTLNILQNALPNLQVGIVAALPSGGVPPYEFQWSNHAPANDTIFNLPGGTYTATVTDANGCTQQHSILLPYGISGTDHYANQNNIRLWPNPATSELFCAWDGELSAVSAAVTDVAGREIWHQSSPQGALTIQVDGWPAGQYMVQIRHRGGVWRKPFVVMR
ncbi:MAG: T9SS type A sorting domain-containing protein [Saprospiraceae bacterium]|nr:T9SS type A sorting domain-containing protein [Saprospiraceae bacterium]